MAKRSAPEVNAGSMADIAFLLLIFFLVTTTIEKDSGINRKLPPIEETEEDVIIKQKNIFTVLLNGKDQLLVEDELMELKDLRAAAEIVKNKRINASIKLAMVVPGSGPIKRQAENEGLDKIFLNAGFE